MKRELARISAILGGVLFFLFLPFLTGQLTLLSSSQDVQSIYPIGAVGAQGTHQQKIIDAGTSGWFVEPMWLLEQHEYFSEHDVPLWNPYMSYGTPIAADMESQPFYPLTLPMVIAPNPVTYAWWIAARFFVAGFFAFLWLRFFVPFTAATAGSIAFMLAGYFIFYYGMPHPSVETLLPLAFYAAELLFRRRTPLATGVFGVAVLLIMLGGMPEAQVLVFSFVSVYWLFRIAASGDGIAASVRLALLYAGASILGILGAAIMLVPLAQFVAISSHIHAPGVGMQAQTVSSSAIAYLLPLIFGPVRNNILEGFAGSVGIQGYFGIVAPIFAVAAFAGAFKAALVRPIAERERMIFFFAASATFLILKQYGSPLASWLGHLPVYDILVYWKYDTPLISWCVAVLCAFGVANVVESRARWTPLLVCALALVFLTAVFFAFDGAVRTQSVHPEYFYGALLLGLLLTIGATAATQLPGLADPRLARFARPSTVGAILCALIAVDLSLNYVIPVFYAVTPEPRAGVTASSGAPYVRFLQQGTAVSHGRVYGEGGLLYPNWSGVFQLSDVRGLDGLFYRKYLPFVRAFFPPVAPMVLTDRFAGDEGLPIEQPLGERWLALSSIEYVVTGDAKFDRQPAQFEKVYEADARIYRVKRTLPRASLFYQVETAANDADALRALQSPATDIFKTVVLTGTAESLKAAVTAIGSRGADAAAGPARIVSYGSQRVEVEADVSRPAILMLADSDFPGWKVYVDGQPAQLITADYWFRAVLLGAGHHSVVFRYQPAAFYAGLLLSCLGMFGLIALLAYEPLKSRVQRRRAAPTTEA
jgi:hypothetical protein